LKLNPEPQKENTMQRIKALDPDRATGKTRELLIAVQISVGMIPNMIRTMANSPAVLEGYLKFRSTLACGRLSARLREQIALAVAAANDSQYCLSAHTAGGKSIGLSEASDDPQEEAALQFALRIVMTRGEASGREVERVRKAGFSDAEIAEIIANVGLNIFANYFNKVAGVVIDFPPAE
jgi:AhpD family alkylhydroperoxidase